MYSSLDISYGGALLKVPLKKLTDKNGNAVNIQPFTDKGAPNVYLWGAPINEIQDNLIYDVQILYDEEELPSTSYTKVERDISAGHGNRKAYVCYATGTLQSASKDKKPIADIVVVGKDEPLATGYTRIPRSLYPEGKPFHLAIAYASDTDLQTANTNMQWLESLKVNDTIDILSSDKQWRLGKIVNFHSNGKTVHVSFNGWTAAFNEDIPRSLRRLAKAGSFTAGKDTGNARRQGAEFQFDYEEIMGYEKKVRMLINDEFPHELKDSFCKAELPQFVFDVMSSKYHEDVTCTDSNGETITLTADGVRDRVNEFNVLMLQYIAKELKDYPRAVAPDVLQHLQRYFLLDHQCNYFYDNHEFMNLSHKDAHKYIGFAASFTPPTKTQSKYWVNNINAFHNAGGFEAIIGRLEYHAQRSNAETVEPNNSTTASASSSTPTSSSSAQPWFDEKAAIETLILAKAVCNTRVIITKEWAAQYFARYRDAVFQRINSLTENQLKKIALNELTKEMESIEALAGSLVLKAGGITTPMGKQIVMGPDFDTTESCDEPSVAFEKQNVDFAVHLLSMDSFVLRLKGLADINAYAQRVFLYGGTNDVYASYYVNSNKNRRQTALSATDFLIKLRDSKVIDVLLGGTVDPKRPPIAPHVQLLTRLSQRDSFLNYVAKQGAAGEYTEVPAFSYTGFTKHHLTLLCDLYRKEIDDSSIRHALMDILQSVSVCMDRDLHDQLYHFLYTIPRHVYDPHLVKNLMFLTREAIDSFSLEIQASYREYEQMKKTASANNNGKAETPLEWRLPDDLLAIESNEDDFHHWYALPQLWAIALDLPPEYATITNMYPTEQQRSTNHGFGTNSSNASVLPSLDTVDAAQTAVLDILSNIDVDDRTITFRLAKMAAESVAKGTANFNTVRMLHRLFRDIPITPTNHRKVTQNLVIQTLQSQYRICEALVSDIQRYKALALIEAQKRGLSLTTSSSASSIHSLATDPKTSAHTGSSSTETSVTVHSTASIDSLIDPKDWIFVGRHKHVDQLLTRLTLLTFIGKAKSSGFSFTADHVDTLWTALVEKAINVEEVEMFFDWLQKSINAGLIPIDQSSIVFDRCFCGTTPRLSTEKLGLKGYECFYALFRQVNVENGKVQYNLLDQLSTRNPDVSGLSTLWNIVLYNENENVATEASHTLVQLHSHLDLPWHKTESSSSTVTPSTTLPLVTRQEVWKKFVTDCVTTIQRFVPKDALTGGSTSSASSLANLSLSPAHNRSLNRVLSILQDFLTELDTLADQMNKVVRINDKTVIPTDYDYPFPDQWTRGNEIFHQPISVSLIERTGYKVSYAPSILLIFRIRKGIDTIGMVRDRAAEYLERDAKKLIVFHKPSVTQDVQILKDDVKLMDIQGKLIIEEASDVPAGDFSNHEYRKPRERISPFLLGIATLLSKQGYQGVTVDSLRQQLDDSYEEYVYHYQAAKRLISDQDNLFDTLFSLLSLKDSAIVQSLWSLINVTLPIPKGIQTEIETLAGHYPTVTSNTAVSWDSILGGKSLMHLHYKLNIVLLLLERDIEKVVSNTPTGSATNDKGTKNNLSVPFGSSGVPEINTPWSKAFVKYGGLQYLYNLVMNLPLSQLFSTDSSSAKLQKDCAAELLNIFSTFIVGPSYTLRYFTNTDSGGTGTEEIFRVDRVKLLNRMLEWLSYVTTVDIPSGGRNTSPRNDSSNDSGPSNEKNENGSSTIAPSTPSRRGAKDTATSPTNGKGSPSGPSSKGSPARSSPIGRGRLQTKTNDNSNAATSAPNSDDKEASTANVDNEDTTIPEVSIVGALWNLITACIVGKDSSAYVSVPRYLKETTDLRMIPTIANELMLSSVSIQELKRFPSIGQVLVTALCAPVNNIVRQHNNHRIFSLLNLADNYAHATVTSTDTNAQSLYHQLRSTVLQLLFDNLHIPYAFPNTCSEYFGLILLLLPGMVATNIVPLPMDEYTLMQTLVHRLRQHPVVEVGSSPDDIVDTALTGLLRTIAAVLRGRPSLKKLAGAPVTMLLPSTADPSVTVPGLGLVDEIFDSCLFSLQPIDDSTEQTTNSITSVFGAKLPKCKQDDTRNAALQVLTELSKDCLENGVYLCRKFMPHHDAQETTAPSTVPTDAKDANLSANSTTDSVDIFRTANAGATLLVNDPTGTSNAGKNATVDTTMKDNTSTELNLASRGKTRIASRNSTGYVGIKNLGCICYMNSTIQQFFMNPAFRRGVLSYKEAKPGTEAERADNIMYQLQRQFAYLQEIDREFYEPRPLCRSIKDWNGNPIDLMEQKDVPEFLTKLFADIESQLQGQPLATLSKDVYGGRQLQELVADDPRGLDRKQLYTAREEEFHFIQVRVKGYKNVQEALAAYVAGESVDYKWTLPDDPDTAEKRVDNAGSKDGPGSNAGGSSSGSTSSSDAGSSAPPDPPKPKEETLKTNKRVSLRSVGDHLMLHLNRFDFDFNRMEQIKLNDRFEFPVVLDMFPYTVYARDENDVAFTSNVNGILEKPSRADFIYDLVGVVIHRGSALGGHYFSYIRERGPNGPVPGDRWYEFNDEHVLPWAGEERLEADCFGGKQIVRNVTAWGNVFENEIVSIESAFCLFYDRRKPESAMHNTVSLVTLPPRTNSAPKDCIVTTDNSSSGSSLTLPKPALVHIPKNNLDIFLDQIKSSYHGGSDAVRKSVRATVPTDLLRTIQNENLEFTRFLYIYTLPYARTILDAVRNFAIEAKALTTTDETSKNNKNNSTNVSALTTYAYPWDSPYLPSAREISSTGHPGLVALRLSIAYLLRTLSDSAHPPGITVSDWEPVVHNLLTISPIAPVWFLQTLLENKHNLANVLLEATTLSTKSTKSLLSKLITQALQVLWPIESNGSSKDTSLPSGPANTDSTKKGGSIPTGKLCLTMIDFLLDRLPSVYRYYNRGGFENYFAILVSFASMDYRARQYLISKRVIAKLMDILLCSRSPFPDINKETGTLLTDTMSTSGSSGSTTKKVGGTTITFKNLGGKKDTNKPVLSSSWSDEEDSIYPPKKATSGSTVATASAIGSTVDLRTADIWDMADLQYDLKMLLHLLRLLVFSCLPLSNRSDAPMVQKYGNGTATLPLTPVDRRFVTHWEFWHLYFASRLIKEDRYSLRKLTYENIGPLLQHLLFGLEPVPLRTTDFPPNEKGARIRYEVEGYGDYHGSNDDGIELSNALASTPPPSTAPVATKGLTFGAKDKQPKEKESSASSLATVITKPKINTGTPGNFVSLLMGIVRYFMRTKGDDQLVGPFELVEFLLKLSDDDNTVYTKRCEFILSHYNYEMKLNTVYYKDTELCLIQLVRWAKKYPIVRFWSSQNWNTLAWAEEWLNKYTEPPEQTNMNSNLSGGNDGMKITKEKPRMDTWNLYSNRASTVTVPDRNPDLYDNVRRLRRNLTLAHRFVDFETDTLTQFVGRSITANASDANKVPYAFEGVIKKILTEGTLGYEDYKFAIQPLTGGAMQNLPVRPHAYYYQIHSLPGEEPGDPDVWNSVNQEWIRNQTTETGTESTNEEEKVEGEDVPETGTSPPLPVDKTNTTNNHSASGKLNPVSHEPVISRSSSYGQSTNVSGSRVMIKETDEDYEEHVGFDVRSDNDDDDDDDDTYDDDIDDFDVEKKPIRSIDSGYKPRSPPPVPSISNPRHQKFDDVDDDNGSDDAQADENDEEGTPSLQDDDNQDIVDHEGEPIFSASGSSLTPTSSVPSTDETANPNKPRFGTVRFGSTASSGSSSSSSLPFGTFNGFGNRSILKSTTGNNNPSSGTVNPPSTSQFSVGIPTAKKATGSRTKSPKGSSPSIGKK